MSEVADRAAAEFLATAYPDERQRHHAERWLGLLACQAANGGRLRWWQIPALAPAQAVLTARRIVLCAVTVVVVGWGIYVGAVESTTGLVGGYMAFIVLGFMRAFAVFAGGVRHPLAHLRPEPPSAIRPHWPGGPKEYGPLLRVPLFYVPVTLWAVTFAVLAVLVRQRSSGAAGLAEAAPARTYRAGRLSCLVTGLAWAPVGALLGALPALGTSVLPEVVAANAVLAVIWGALLSGPYPLLKVSEVVMSADWEDRIRFLPLLEDAANRGVLRRGSGGYVVRDEALLARLTVSGRAALGDHTELRARRAARKGVRATLVKCLTRRGRIRVCVDLTVGAAAAAATGFGLFAAGHGGVVARSGGPPVGWLLFPTSVLIGAMVGLLAGGVMFWVILLLASCSKMTLTYVPRLSRKGRRGWAVVAAAAAALLVAGEGTALAKFAAFVLPAVLVMACGTWACVLSFRRTCGFRRRWQRIAPDVIAAATTAAALLLLVDRRLLAVVPAAGLLFPVAGWGSFSLWRKMCRSERLAIRAGSDLVFALLLGGEVVLLLVWLANLLGMPRAEVAVLRAVLSRVGGLADLPWWAWTGAWLLLAAASLAFIRWPTRLKSAAARFKRWRVVSVAEITERALTGLHIGLLALVFVGLAAPPALTPTVSRQLSAAYEVAFQRELLQEGELAAYTAISSQLAGQPQSQVLTHLVTEIHYFSTPEDPREASRTETDNARLLGEAEALALGLAAPQSLDPTARAATAAAGLTEPVPEPSVLAERAAAVQEQETKQDGTARQVEAAADLAARVVASLISIPQLSDNEVVQVVREYLAGLVEDSTLKNRFAAWIERLPGAKPPPDAETEVIPVAERLEQAATAELSAQFTAAGDDDPVTDPSETDPALSKAQAENPLNAAVDIINQARYAQDQSGQCVGCVAPGHDDDNPPGEQPPEDHPEEP